MKTPFTLHNWSPAIRPVGALIAILAFTSIPLLAADNAPVAKDRAARETDEERVIVETVETDAPPARAVRRELPWLGVSAEEAPEALTAQLGLDPGVGLVVEYVGESSPAAKAGLKKNDLLVEFEGQALVHPAQLRKLVQARKVGDLVKVAFYRAGKKETATAKLEGKEVGLGLPGEEWAWRGDLRELQRQLRDVPWGEEFQRGMEALRETFRQQLGPEQRQAITDQVREATEQARRAAHEALQAVTNSGLRELRQALQELERAGVGVAPEARVTVHTSASESKSMVHSDDTGTYVLVGNPSPRLTVHGPDGKLVFDGPVDTADERAKVPREIWEKVEPMLEKFSAPSPPPAPRAKSPTRRGGDRF
jgi:HPt (histidine-containing phosphotransfer) domain-containing protein